MHNEPIRPANESVRIGSRPRRLIPAVPRDGVVAIMRQILELRANERLGEIADHLPLVIGLSNADLTQFLFISRAYEQIWGRTVESLYARSTSFLEGVHPDDRGRVKEALEGLVRGEPVEAIEYRVVRPDGSTCWVLGRGFAIRDAEGRIIRLAGSAEDITKRKALEDQLRQSQKMEAVGQLAGGIAHDFNNLLLVILGQCQLISKQIEPTSAIYGRFQEIQKAAERGKWLTTQLLIFSRQKKQELKVIDLNAQVVTDLRELLERLIGEDIVLVTLIFGYQDGLMPIFVFFRVHQHFGTHSGQILLVLIGNEPRYAINQVIFASRA